MLKIICYSCYEKLKGKDPLALRAKAYNVSYLNDPIIKCSSCNHRITIFFKVKS